MDTSMESLFGRLGQFSFASQRWGAEARNCAGDWKDEECLFVSKQLTITEPRDGE